MPAAGKDAVPVAEEFLRQGQADPAVRARD
jgi:hypothetical protein